MNADALWLLVSEGNVFDEYAAYQFSDSSYSVEELEKSYNKKSDFFLSVI